MRANRGPAEIAVGMIGAGAIARQRHLPNLLAIPGVRVLGVVNRTDESSRRVAAEFGIPRVYRHWREAVEDPDTQAVVIGAWPDLHAPAAIAALERGKHVLCEARMAATAAEARAMWAAARSRPDVVAQLVPAPFTLEVDATVRRWMDEGRLGRLLLIEHCDAGGPFRPEEPAIWRHDRRRNGFNFRTLGIVYEQIHRWVGEAVRVTAHGAVFARRRRLAEGGWIEVSAPDHVDVAADMACGALLHLQMSAVATPKHPEARGIWLYGTEGVLRVDGEVLQAGDGRGRMTPVRISARERRGWRVEADFIDAIRGRAPVRLTTFEDGVRYMDFTEAVWRSMAQGRAVALPLELDVGGAPTAPGL